MNLTAAEHKSFGGIRRKSYDSAKVEIKSVSDSDYTVEVLVTSISIDREGEVVLPSAVAKRLAVYFLNPILLWGHKRRKGPKYALGVCLAMTPTADGSGWIAKFRYDVDINPKAALVWSQIKAGTQRSWSISFLPWAWVTKYSSAEEINALPEIVRGWLLSGQCKVVYTDVEIIEISNIHVGSNRDAILRAIEEQLMKVDPELPGVPVATETPTVPAEQAAKAVAPPVEKAAVKSKYHPKVNDISGRLRELAYSLEGPGWDDYDGEKMPPPERVAACLEIIGEIQHSMQNLLTGSNAAAPPVPVNLAATAAVTEKAVPVVEPPAVVESPTATDKAVAGTEPVSPVEPEPEVPEFDPIAAAQRYLDSILS